MKCRLIAGFVVALCTIGHAIGADNLSGMAGPTLIIPRFDGVELRIDGDLSDSIWSRVPVFDDMQVVSPDVLTDARYKTETRLFYTAKGLFVGSRAQQPQSELLARLSSRDKQVNRDGINLYLDTSGTAVYGLFFGVNLGGTLLDGTLLPERQLSRLWDGPWDGRTQVTEDGYSIEMFLPWSMMSLPDITGKRTMGIAIERRVANLDETWSWPALPNTQPQFLSGFQRIEIENINPGQQFAIYPFVAATLDRTRDKVRSRVGADIFWRPSSNMQLSATLNPDFGIVESDDVVVNLTEFETFFPEKRLFFLEGSEIFITSPRSEIRGTNDNAGARTVPNTFSLQPTTLINTRRIGGAPRSPEIPAGVNVADIELSQPSELLGAVKLTGSKGRIRYGLMLAAEDDTSIRGEFADGTETRINQQGRDFGVARFLYEHAGKGRKAIGWMSTLVAHPEADAMSHGVDLHYRSAASKVIWDAQLLASDVDDNKGYGGYVDLNYIPVKGILHRFTFDYIDKQLDISDFGFIRRNDVVTFRYSYQRQKSGLKNLRNRKNWLSLSHETNTSGRVVRSSIFFRNTLTFLNSSELNSTLIYRPAQWNDTLTEGNGDFKTDWGGIAEISYGTDTAQTVSTSIAINAVSEVFGDYSYTVKGGISYKPNDRFSFDLDFQYRIANEWLIHLNGPVLGTYDAKQWQPSVAMDVFFSAKQQLRFSLQWTGIRADAQQLYSPPPGDGNLVEIGDPGNIGSADFTISRMTAQLRYRWEIAPLSDLFIVYTRGSNLPNRGDDSFGDLFSDALSTPVIDRFVIKLRYRFGN